MTTAGIEKKRRLTSVKVTHSTQDVVETRRRVRDVTGISRVAVA